MAEAGLSGCQEGDCVLTVAMMQIPQPNYRPEVFTTKLPRYIAPLPNSRHRNITRTNPFTLCRAFLSFDVASAPEGEFRRGRLCLLSTNRSRWYLIGIEHNCSPFAVVKHQGDGRHPCGGLIQASVIGCHPQRDFGRQRYIVS